MCDTWFYHSFEIKSESYFSHYGVDGKGYSPSIKLSWCLVCLFFPDVVHVKVFAYMGLHPKTEKSYRNFLNEKQCVNMFILSNFRAGKGYPPSIKLYWFLVCLFFPDVVHVKVFAYMGLHPKTGKKLPQLSQWKALCKHVHFEQFSGWERVPPIHKALLIPGLPFFPRRGPC